MKTNYPNNPKIDNEVKDNLSEALSNIRKNLTNPQTQVADYAVTEEFVNQNNPHAEYFSDWCISNQISNF